MSNPSAFWRHWHISLSVWLRDYVYIPLGGNRGGAWRTYRNLLVTMLLGGLWHGAGLAYLLWGFYHGLLLAVQRLWSGPGRPRDGTVGRWGQILLVVGFFHLTCLGWLFFRAGGVARSRDQWRVLGEFTRALVHLPVSSISPFAMPIFLLGGLALLLQWKNESMDRFSCWPAHWQAAGVGGSLVALASLGVFENSSFIYFQF